MVQDITTPAEMVQERTREISMTSHRATRAATNGKPEISVTSHRATRVATNGKPGLTSRGMPAGRRTNIASQVENNFLYKAKINKLLI